MTEPRVFRLPDVGEGLIEAEVLRWLVAVGDEVAVNDPIVEIETAKASVELPSPFAGRVLALHASAGQVLPVGVPLISFDGGDGGDVGDAPAVPEREAVLVGYGVAPTASVRRRKRTVAAAPVAAPVAAPAASRPLASPLVRVLAREWGVELALVSATGHRGQVTRADLARHRESASSLGGTPVRGVQRSMAAAMTRSAAIPQASLWVDVDVTSSQSTLERLRADAAFEGARVTMLTLVASAVLAAARDHPLVTSRWHELPDGSAEIVESPLLNLGIAADTARGLVVPVVADAGGRTLPELATEITRLIEASRAGSLSPADLSGGTLTITNVGVFGIDGGLPLLNPGESVIVAMGQARPRPWVVGDSIVPRPVMQLVISFDHRVLDGAAASRFLADVARGLSGTF